LSLQIGESRDIAIVLKHPVVMYERMAVLFGDRATGRGANMGEKTPRFELCGEMLKNLVVPSRADLSILAECSFTTCPCHAEPIAIGGKSTVQKFGCKRAVGQEQLSRSQALINQRVVWFYQHILKRDS